MSWLRPPLVALLLLSTACGAESAASLDAAASEVGSAAGPDTGKPDEDAPDVAPIADAAPAETAEPQDDTAADGDTAAGGDTAADGDTAAADCPGAPASEQVARTTIGSIRGVADGDGLVFRGIPYAAAPIGAARFRPPAPYASAEAPGCLEPDLAADTFGAECLQLDGDDQVIGSEDCLTLNVWTPTPLELGPAPRPVMVFVHGGGHVQGSGTKTLPGGKLIYDGRRLADATGALVLTFNYRLGPFGYLALPEMDASGEQVGNFGLSDQLAALRWTHDHIAAFGGDPARVMVFGESAGAVSTCALVAAPGASGLFHAALMESGACIAATKDKAAASNAARIDSATDCAAGPGRLECLRAKPADVLLRAVPGSVNIGSPVLGGGGSDYGPIVDGAVLPLAPLDAITSGKHNAVPMIIGSNAEELAEAVMTPVPTAAALETQLRLSMTGLVPSDRQDAIVALYDAAKYESPKAAYVAFLSDIRFSCSARIALASFAAGQDAPVYRYYFSRRAVVPNGGTKAAVHGIELTYVFGSLANIPLFTPSADDVALSQAMMALWGTFAASKAPAAPGAPVWPEWTPAADQALVLDVPLSVGADLRAAECEALQFAVTGAP